MAVIHTPPHPTHDLNGTRFTSLATPRLGTTDTAVWTVEIDPGTPATPHSLTREEVFIVLDGSARARIGELEEVATAGDAVVVPAEREFQISCEGSSVLRMLCCLPVGGQAVAGGAVFTPPWAE